MNMDWTLISPVDSEQCTDICVSMVVITEGEDGWTIVDRSFHKHAVSSVKKRLFKSPTFCIRNCNRYSSGSEKKKIPKGSGLSKKKLIRYLNSERKSNSPSKAKKIKSQCADANNNLITP